MSRDPEFAASFEALFTPAEHAQFLADTAVFGQRVAWWLARETQGWSALDELIYWGGLGKVGGDPRRERPRVSWSPRCGAVAA